jgi:hypothetical protein
MNECVGFAGVLHRFLQAIRILAAVPELKRIDRQHVLADFIAPFGVHQRVEAGPGTDAHVVTAFRADELRLQQLRAVKHSLAARTLGPQAFGNDLARRAFFPLDARWKDLVDPAHVIPHL